MNLGIGTILNIIAAVLLVIVALLLDLRTAAFVAGLYLIVYFVFRIANRRKRTGV